MTFAIELRVPPPKIRERIWGRLLTSSKFDLPKEEIRVLAVEFDAPPALAAGAVRAAELTGGGAAEIRRTVGSIAKVMTGGRTPRRAETTAPMFDAALTQANVNLDALACRLAQPNASRAFSLCLYGPPGTGKSAYVRHLAGLMGLEVTHRRTSDLLSMWVGQSEKNIARAFEDARAEGSFLIFDEADSLLADRQGAERSWEVTQVNEMLTWMECHDHPFACTTNLMDKLDSASLRRFTFKIRFDYMTAQQSSLAFARFFDQPAPETLGRLGMLTPGDFAVVLRKARILGSLGDPMQLVEMLKAEQEAKPQSGRPIGFGAPI
jgi:hypothetical protein